MVQEQSKVINPEIIEIYRKEKELDILAIRLKTCKDLLEKLSKGDKS
jgi:hypothetical protein